MQGLESQVRSSDLPPTPRRESLWVKTAFVEGLSEVITYILTKMVATVVLREFHSRDP